MIQEYIEGPDFATFCADKKTIHAIAHNLTAIGEAAGRVPPEVQQRHSVVPWVRMRGMRNVLVHEYFRIDLPSLWETATRDVPGLVPPLQDFLAREA